MKLGLKTYDNSDFINYFKNKVDFIEIMSFVDKQLLLDKTIVVHSKHSKFGINPADIKKEKENLAEIKISQDLADFCKSNKIIVHPGFIENETCSKDQAIKIIKKITDKRIIIENMPKMNNGVKLCSTPEEMKEFLKKTGKGFCFDINHAISSAFENNLDPYIFIKDFIKLNPTHIHLGGHTLPDNKTHLALTESNIDLEKVLRLLPENSDICLEVTQNIEKTEKDIKLLKKIWKETQLRRTTNERTRKRQCLRPSPDHRHPEENHGQAR